MVMIGVACGQIVVSLSNVSIMFKSLTIGKYKGLVLLYIVTNLNVTSSLSVRLSVNILLWDLLSICFYYENIFLLTKRSCGPRRTQGHWFLWLVGKVNKGFVATLERDNWCDVWPNCVCRELLCPRQTHVHPLGSCALIRRQVNRVLLYSLDHKQKKLREASLLPLSLIIGVNEILLCFR
jgi:hypothetical protein